MQLFYCPDLKYNSQKTILPEQESKHCIRVLRMKKGDKLNIIDGKGGVYKGVIIDGNQKKCEVKITHYESQEKRQYYIHIAIAPTKNFEKIEWFIEKCVEFGIDEISFIITKHSERKIIKDERVFKTALAATKQSIKSKIPILNKIINFNSFLENNKNSKKYIAFVKAQQKNLLAVVIEKNKDYCVMIGPEGGFTKEEVIQANKLGFTAISLGNNRLRTETAGIAACHILNLFGG